MKFQGGNGADNQIRAGLCRIFDPDVEACFEPGPNHQTILSGELQKRSFNGIQDLWNDGGYNGSFNSIPTYAVNIQNHLNIDTVFVGSLGSVRPEPCLKNNRIVVNSADYNVGISNINCQNHFIASKSSLRRVRHLRIFPFSVSIHPALPPK